MEVNGKKFGIWGFGVVGKAAAHFLARKGCFLEILDKKILSQSNTALIQELGALYIKEQNEAITQAFIKHNDHILVSPGIDLNKYQNSLHKFIAELDLFYDFYKKPIIAITGSVGKTTITTLLSHILRSYNSSWWTGGNIGTGALDALNTHTESLGAVLEVSSFQLELCQRFAPNLAIITNIHPNHLDRHGNIQNYIKAKSNIISHQNREQVGLIPFSLRSIINRGASDSTLHYFSPQPIGQSELDMVDPESIVFFVEHNQIKAYNNRSYITLINIDQLPNISFIENWLIICSALFLMQIPLHNLQELCSSAIVPEHRLEYVTTINGIDFFNDSKGTSTTATAAAIEKLKSRPIVLILAGLSKGVDRAAFIGTLQHKVKAITCCGKERDELAAACKKYAIPYIITQTIDQAVRESLIIATSGDQIVLSPAGSSFDQFKNYEERGRYFKECVYRLQSQ
jgi:UDP-N-acetylmuramoylalanine--D-glutamate ligase